MKRQINLKQLTFLPLLIFLFISCNNTEKDWEKTIKESSITGYNEFIKTHSDSVYNKLASNAIDSLQWLEDSISKDTTKIKKHFLLGKTSKYSLRAQNLYLTLKGAFTDPRDGKVYKIVVIGTQIWMAENLDFAIEGGSWCYNNSSSNCKKYGRLYNFEAAKTACPAGWHLPSDAEWKKLINYTVNDAAYKLKSKSGWQKNGYGKTADDYIAIDLYGFSALPGGRRYSWDGGKFDCIGTNGDWWTSTASGGGVIVISMASSGKDEFYLNATKDCGSSVRCVKD
jgi:uncharacterized protein (TIGR02145 family)